MPSILGSLRRTHMKDSEAFVDDTDQLCMPVTAASMWVSVESSQDIANEGP